jgi:hypothetical protein
MQCAIACTALPKRSNPFAAKELRKTVNNKPPGDVHALSAAQRIAGFRSASSLLNAMSLAKTAAFGLCASARTPGS